MIVVGAGVTALLLAAAWSNLEPWTIGLLVIRPRPWLYVVFLSVFFAMARRVFSTVRPSSPLTLERGLEEFWPYAVLTMAGGMLWRWGLIPSQHLGLTFIAGLDRASGLQILRVFQPHWLHAMAPVELGQYRPLKFLLLWAAIRINGASVILIGGHVAVAALIAGILQCWGVRRWVATMTALGFLMHPLMVRYVGTITIQYVWGTLAFLAALRALQWWMDRPSPARLGLVLSLYAASTLFVESWIGGAAILVGVLIAQRTASRATAAELPISSMSRATVLILLVVAAVTSLHLYALLQEPSRLQMAATPRIKRLLLNLWFDPYWAFFMPFEAKATMVQLIAVGSVAVVPAWALLRNASLGWQAPVLWVTTGLSLGPALMFFEMAPQWSTGRVAYGPSAVLAMCLGVIIAQTTSRRVAAIWATLCCLSLIALSLIQHTSREPADLGGELRQVRALVLARAASPQDRRPSPSASLTAGASARPITSFPCSVKCIPSQHIAGSRTLSASPRFTYVTIGFAP
jgi:hypothetical protein